MREKRAHKDTDTAHKIPDSSCGIEFLEYIPNNEENLGNIPL